MVPLQNLRLQMVALQGKQESKKGNCGVVTGSLAHTCKQMLGQDWWMLLSD